jgi:iron complex outermembrane receptor protein
MTSTSRALLLGALLATVSPAAVLAAETPDTPPAQPAAATAVSGISVTATHTAAQDKLAPTTTESVTATDIAQTVNALNVEDDLKYLPSLVVRKRHIGDTQAPLATRTSGVGSSARSLIYVDGMLISSLIGNNNTTASPRWSMAPEQAVDHIDVLYGPFSAAYAGNSIGAVVEITTHMPTQFEAQAKVAGSLQSFSLYGTHDDYGAGQASFVVGDRWGPLALRFSDQRTVSDGQPLGLATSLRSTSIPAGAVAVTGGFNDTNRAGQPILVAGANGLEHQIQDNQTLRATYELTPKLDLAYTLGRFANTDTAHAETYLRDASGAPVYSASSVTFGGIAYGLPASAFFNGVYRLDEEHWLNGLSAHYDGDQIDLRLSASRYDFGTDVQKAPTVALPAATSGGAGTVTRLDGTGWSTLDGQAIWRPDGMMSANTFSLGGHFDRDQLQSLKTNTANWITAPAGAVAQISRGVTQTDAVYVQDVWAIQPQLKLTLGARYEQWDARNGFNFSKSTVNGQPDLLVSQPALSDSRTSPKASLEWKADDHWRFTASYGDAYRFPTVSELYQVISSGSQQTTANPFLRPEHARSSELAAEWSDNEGRVRLSLFNEDLSDALIAQTTINAALNAQVSTVQNVNKVKSQGAEAVFERHNLLFHGVDVTASLTYVDSTTEADPAFPTAVGKQTPQVPKWRSSVTATWRPDTRWILSAGLRASSKMYATLDNSDVNGHTYQGFEGYVVADARVSYQLDKHWMAAVGVDNLGGENYFLFHPFPQRSVTAELNYKF